jgi:uncharacterized protein YbjT (DUF2867 family)
MAIIAVIGGTGYAGRHIVAEAADRGHTVLSVAARSPPTASPASTYVEGTLLDVPPPRRAAGRTSSSSRRAAR